MTVLRRLVLGLLVGVVLGALPGRATGEAPGASLEAVFAEGRRAYDAMDYAGAIREWQKLRQFRIEAPEVEYNLGNAYYKAGDYGRAVLHWERALRLDPSDGEARENLRLVRSLLVDEVRGEPSQFERVFDVLRRAARPEQSALVSLLLWELFGLALLLAILRPGRARSLGLALALGALLLLAVVVPAFLLQAGARDDRSRQVVVVDSVPARSGPGEQYTTVITLHEGLVVEELESVSGWLRVRLPNGLVSWLPDDTLERI